jgi:hypothetical protein
MWNSNSFFYSSNQNYTYTTSGDMPQLFSDVEYQNKSANTKDDECRIKMSKLKNWLATLQSFAYEAGDEGLMALESDIYDLISEMRSHLK